MHEHAPLITQSPSRRNDLPELLICGDSILNLVFDTLDVVRFLLAARAKLPGPAVRAARGRTGSSLHRILDLRQPHQKIVMMLYPP